MGERIRWVVSVDADTQRLADRWQAQFSPLVGDNRSSLVRLVFKTLDRLGMTAANVLAALSQGQELRDAIEEQVVIQRHNLSSPDVVRPPQKAPVRTSASVSGRSPIRSVSKRVAVGEMVALPSYTPTPFRAGIRPLFAQCNRRFAA